MITAFMTIDDIAAKNTAAIVDYLKEKNIPAVMFAVGDWAKNQYENAIYAVKNGIIVGNHSMSHPYFSQLSFEDAVAEIENCEKFLDQLYADAGVERKIRPFRFPYGDRGGENQEKLAQYLIERGFDKLDDSRIKKPEWDPLRKAADTLWTFDAEEWQIRPDSGKTMDYVFERMEDFLIFHSHDETEAMVPEYYKIIVDRFLSYGIKFLEPEFVKL